KVTVTYTAKDANGNPVSELTNLGLLVDGITGYTFVAFADQGNGIYTGTLTGIKSGTASLMPLWDGAKAAQSAAPLTLTAGPVAPTNSTVTVSVSSIVANGTTTTKVTYTAKDVNGNPASGLTVTLNVTGVTDTSFSGFIETGTSTGIYTGTLSGITAGTAILMPQVDSAAAAKAIVTLTLTQWASVVTSVTANGYTFTTPLKAIAFGGAFFTLNPPTGTVSDFTWTSANSNITVSDIGKVTLLSTAYKTLNTPVTITGKPKVAGAYPVLTYTFTITAWVYPTTTGTLLNSSGDVNCINISPQGRIIEFSVYGTTTSVRGANASVLLSVWGFPTEDAYPGNAIAAAATAQGSGYFRAALVETYMVYYSTGRKGSSAYSEYRALCYK
ncbi:MAG: invasin domain 3-containing protein, partial [Enterobacterales bacterium]|uniref:invasin domain 3-containing protein n=1 Tax=Serratia sp. (in: enterobacteria) TaxID=616 RepID=UPI003F337E1F